MAEQIKVASAKSIEKTHCLRVEAMGQNIALFKIGGDYFAIGDTCTHRGGPLSEGKLVGTIVTCPWHGAKFDVTSGAVMGAPARTNVPSFKVIVEGEDIKIEVP